MREMSSSLKSVTANTRIHIACKTLADLKRLLSEQVRGQVPVAPVVTYSCLLYMSTRSTLPIQEPCGAAASAQAASAKPMRSWP